MLRVMRLADLACDLEDEEAAAFGGKARGLAGLLARGLPVPDGFAVAFEAGHPPSLTDEEKRELRSEYHALRERAGRAEDGACRVAVRSSAANEDGSEHSFAGLYETLLDVDEAGLVGAVERCLGSLHAPRVAAYRAWNDSGPGSMGVLVQRMVEAELSGVCFTRSPHSEKDITLEVVEGLGERLVSGERTPGRASLARDSLDVCVESDAEGVLERLGLERTREVARLALEAEAVLGQPADVEWAIDADSIQLLQARPITGLAATETSLEEIRRQEIEALRSITRDAGRLVVWTDISVADMLPRLSPLGHEIINRLSLRGGSVETSLREIGLSYRASDRCGDHFAMIAGRTYLNASGMLDSFDPPLPVTFDERRLDVADGGSLDIDGLPLRLAWPGWRAALRIPDTLARLAFVTVPRFLRLRPRFDEEFWQRVAPAVRADAAELRALDLADLSNRELWDALGARIQRFIELHHYHKVTDLIAFATHALLRASLRTLYGKRLDEVEIALTTGLPRNFNTETNLDLARVAQGSLSLEELLERYGHRGSPDYEVSAPRWREEPERIEAMARAIAGAERDPLAQFEKQVRAREEAEERLARDLSSSRVLRPLRGAILRELRYYQRYSPLREGTQGCCYQFVELIRLVLLEAGRRTGLGDRIFFLSMAELEQLLCGPADAGLVPALDGAARERRERLKLARRLYVPHALHSGDLEAIGRLPAVSEDARELRGVAVSAGTVRGRARVVESIDEAAELEPGEILVTVSADPSWTPLFLVAGGLVLEQGGLLSHPAIVAREHGLPAVVNVTGATRVLRTGQEITLDGDSGRVLLPLA